MLGSHSPLLQSVFFLNGKYFPSQRQIGTFLCISELQCLSNPDRYVYIENGSKNHPGGLKDTGPNKVFLFIEM